VYQTEIKYDEVIYKSIMSSKVFNNKKGGDTISVELIQTIRERLMEGKPVRRTLPFEGRLHIDRALPFLIIYRKPVDRMDEGTDRLVKGEASYLLTSANKKLQPSLRKLVRMIIDVFSEKFKSVLIIEIWSDPEFSNKLENESLFANYAKPSVSIITSARPPAKTVEALENDFKRIKINKRSANVNVITSDKRTPGNLPDFISNKEAQNLNCFTVGLKVSPAYRDSETGVLFPIALRQFHHGLSNAIKKAVFIFSKNQTNLQATNYQALGRHAFVKAVLQADIELAHIDSTFDFLLLMTPVNINENWTKFRKNNFEKVPVFYYRLLPADPSIIKRQLFKIPVERVEDPVLASLFREKRTELSRKLTMLEDRNTRAFIYGSIQLYGEIDRELKELAINLLLKIQPHSREVAGDIRVDAPLFAELANREFKYYHNIYSGFNTTVQIRKDVPGLIVSSGKLLISEDLDTTVSRAEALIQHEVGTHIVTYYNGQSQTLKLLRSGLAGYEEMQEGLAVLAEYFADGLTKSRIRLLAARVIASDCLINGASFIETFRILNSEYGFGQHTSYGIVARTFRGGGLTKDIIYLRGLNNLLKYLKAGGDIDPLYIGKIAMEHVPVINELLWRKVLHPAPLRPRYFEFESTSEKLLKLREGLNVIDLISNKKQQKKTK
jgi:uncharacterized protein (TIGR02421 family)